MKIEKLRSVCKHAQEIMQCFTWRVLTRKEVEELGIADPPCAMLMGTSINVQVTLAVDGEVYCSDGAGITLSPAHGSLELAQEIAKWLRQA